MSNFFSKTTDESLKELNSSLEGLSSNKATELLNTVGENILNEKEKKSMWSIFFDQFKDFLVIILIIAAIISAVTGNMESTIVIIAVRIIRNWFHNRSGIILRQIVSFNHGNQL